MCGFEREYWAISHVTRTNPAARETTSAYKSGYCHSARRRPTTARHRFGNGGGPKDDGGGSRVKPTTRTTLGRPWCRLLVPPFRHLPERDIFSILRLRQRSLPFTTDAKARGLDRTSALTRVSTRCFPKDAPSKEQGFLERENLRYHEFSDNGLRSYSTEYGDCRSFSTQGASGNDDQRGRAGRLQGNLRRGGCFQGAFGRRPTPRFSER
jgi:hypothetical protein